VARSILTEFLRIVPKGAFTLKGVNENRNSLAFSDLVAYRLKKASVDSWRYLPSEYTLRGVLD
jgi:hypothetical protein